MLTNLWNILLDIIYPPKCPACKIEVEVHGQWCQECKSEFLAPRFISIEDHKLKKLDMCLAVCEYRGALKRIIHDMKFRKKKQYALHMQSLLTEGVKLSGFGEIHGVIPVPLAIERLKERGYNQAECIFKAWAQQRGFVWLPDVLIRSKHTAPQWELNLADRRQNIKDAFKIMRPEKVKAKNILLVDDIFTTGITLEECAKVLKKCGANKVCALVVASGAR